MKEEQTMYTNFESLREEARAHILETLEGYEGYTCDFHNEAFNSDYYECYILSIIIQSILWMCILY